MRKNSESTMINSDRILECVPNFSEGRDKRIIGQIEAAISAVDGVKVLHVDSGEGANRTVITFAGDPDAVVEAAFQAVKKAAEVIDMSKHRGEHPRFGATDVLPLIPIAGVTMDEAVEYARLLGKRIGEELHISVFSYGEAAYDARRRNLAYCRAREYEGLAEKMSTPDGVPDFGPHELNIRSGASAVGARDFLIAYNVNLNTDSVKIASAIAADVRESGRKNATGIVPGTLKSVRAIGWYIEEFGKAQVSMNLTNIRVTPLHQAFDEVAKKALLRGVSASGSEIVGLVPLESMLEAGRYFLLKQDVDSSVLNHHQLIDAAVEAMGLNELYPFDPAKKILEYAMAQK